MSYAHNNHYKWIEDSLEIKCSELGKDVANILGFVGKGIYNCPINHKKIDWSNTNYIDVTWRGSFSNYDFSKLTELIIECFYNLIRVSIKPHSFEYLKLQFHKRKTRNINAHMCEKLPTLEYMIEQQRELFGRKNNG